MPSYVAPQVDHNLYTPVLPQTNVAQIFELMGVKQSIYNQNLARINTQLSTMEDLSNMVTNDNTKQKINEYNKQANETLKKYTNLDFSIVDNVRAVDNLYTPLLQDQDFITDYSATSHINSQMQKGFSFRDSSKKEERDAFSVTNMNHVTGPMFDLKNAKNSKELKLAAAKASSRYYVPYTDYSANLAKYMKDYDAKIVHSNATGGYIVKTTNMGKTDSYGLEKFLDMVLSDHDKQQMRIEAQVQVDNLTRQKGIDNLTTDYIQHSIDNNEKIKSAYTQALGITNSQIEALPSADLMNNEQRELLNSLLDEKETIGEKLNSLENKSKEISNISKKIKDGTFNYSDFSDILTDELYNDNKNNLVRTMASSYIQDHSSVEISSDSTYIANQTNQREYAKMNQADRFHNDEMINKALDRKKDYAVAGIELDENGNPILSNATPGKEAYIEEDAYSAIMNDVKQGMLNDNDKNSYRTEMINAYIREKGKSPDKNIQRILGSMNREEVWYSPEMKKIRSKYLNNLGSKSTNANVAKQELQEIVDMYNKENKTELIINNKGEVVNKDDSEGVLFKDFNILSSVWKIGQTIANPLVNVVSNRDTPGDYINDVKKTQHDIYRKNEDHSEKFKQYFNKVYNGNYSAGITNTKTIQATKAGRTQYNNEYATVVDSYVRSNPDATVAGLSSYNPNVSNEVLNEAYKVLNSLNNNTEALPHVTVGRAKGGTRIQFPSVEWKDVYPGLEYDSEEAKVQRQAFDLLKNKSLNLPLPVEYAQVDQHRARVYAGKPTTHNNYFTTIDQNGEAYVTPTKDNYHYISHNSNGGSFKLKLNEDGKYELVPSKKPLSLGSYDKINDTQVIDNYNYIKGNAETEVFKNQLTQLINKNKNLIKEEGDGTFFVPSSIESQIYSLLTR